MSTAIATVPQTALDSATIASVLLSGDLARLTAEQRLAYCTRVCETLGLNPLTQPFAFLVLNGKTVMYAKKDATEQLRKVHGVSITSVTSQRMEDVFVVTANAVDRSGRTDASTGAVEVGNLKGEKLANALMKAETKAKRRVTLSICGLGVLDETEVEQFQEPLTVKATKQIDLPEGTVQIVSSKVEQWGGDIEVVDDSGVVTVHKTADRQCAVLAEQIAQEHVPVTLTFEKITRGKNAGKDKLVGVKRWEAAKPVSVLEPDQPVLTAEQIPF
jgi:hypothetical protein